MTDEAPSAFFAHDGERFVPQSAARGFWQEDSVHGRALTGLLGAELERRCGADGFVPVRYTADLHRMAPFRPLTVETRLLREGGRLRLAEAALVVDGVEYARATCQFLRAGEPPEGAAPSPPPWNAPPPDQLEPRHRGSRTSDERVIRGSFGSPFPREVWLREKNLLIAGEDYTPFSRLATSADFASPFSHASPAGIGYINSDVTVLIHRLPEGEWIGFEATGHEASQGIAVGHCRLHDAQGAVGYVATTALAMKRRK